MRLSGVLVPRKQQLQNAAFCKERFVFTCLTYKNVPPFRKEPVYQFYGLKANQMNKVGASSHEYPHVEKNTNLREQNFKGVANNKQLDSEDTQQEHFSSYLLSKLNSCVQYC